MARAPWCMSRPSRSSASASGSSGSTTPLADVEQQQRMSYLIFGGLLGSIFIIMLVLLNYILSRVVIKPRHLATGRHAAHDQRGAGRTGGGDGQRRDRGPHHDLQPRCPQTLLCPINRSPNKNLELQERSAGNGPYADVPEEYHRFHAIHAHLGE
ncbi:MAG: hypothetical protein MZV70_14175 [Desulfobacterales bacterium]|nr:hypothetical protein [Desulfobacterales bacterium]